jgi:hypothetical protein
LTQVHMNEVACQIFRHAVYKNTGEQIPAHAPKELCDILVANDRVIGCAKPFKFVRCERKIENLEGTEVNLNGCSAVKDSTNSRSSLERVANCSPTVTECSAVSVANCSLTVTEWCVEECDYI